MKRSVHKNLNKLIMAVLGVIITFTGMAQTTYTTQASGNWNSPSTWVGGNIPSSSIGSGKVVMIRHAVTFNLNSDLSVSGTLDISGDSLKFPSSYSKDIKINTGGLLTVNNGVFYQNTNGNSDMIVDRGRIVFSNSKIYVSNAFMASKGAGRSIRNSIVYLGGKYELNGNSTFPSVDTIQNSIIETGIDQSGDFRVRANNTLRAANAYIRVSNGDFQNDGNASIQTLAGAVNNYAFDQLKVKGDLINSGAWVARIDAACISGSIQGSQMAAIDFTRAQDCGAVPLVGSAPELIFTNPVLKSGQANKEGAVYRFPNVIPGVDAEIKLKKFSRNDIYMQTIDLANMGWGKAFQPQFGLRGNVGPNQEWYIDFELKFYNAGTNQSRTLPKVDMTALDVDGDGVSITEYAIFQNPANVMYSTVSYLATQPAGVVGQTFTCPLDNIASTLIPCVVCGGDGKIGIWNLTDCPACNGTGAKYSSCNHAYNGTTGNVLLGPVENFVNIDTAATQVMATYQYTDVNKIDFRYGGKSGSRASNAGVRLNSLWFRQFSLAPPTILPVKLSGFSAMLNKKDVIVSWTAEEENFSHYVIQRSTDGKNYSDIALVFANNAPGASNYSYKDANVSSATNSVFYRLLMVDKVDEGGHYSETRVIRLGKEAESLQLVTYPNPVTADKVQVTLPGSWQGKPVMLQLYSSNGVLMQSMQIGSASQTESLQLSKTMKGFYFIKATCNGEVAQQRIIKN